MTPRPATLRRRVALAAALVGLLLCSLFAGALLVMTKDYETVLAHEILHGQAENYALHVGNGLPATLPRTQRLSGYHGDTPPRYAAYPPGVREDPDRDGLHVGVFDTRAGRLVFVLDLGDIEQLKRHRNVWFTLFLLLGVALSTLVGWWLAGRALTPVKALSDAVDALDTAPSRTHLARHTPADELGRLARAIDDYQGRLVDADASLRAFFADASHELRTPVAVLRGATDVMLDDDAFNAAHAPRLARLDRAVHELGDLIDALFVIARRTPVERMDLDLRALVDEAVASFAQPPALQVDGGTGHAHVARDITVLLLRIALRKAARAGIVPSLQVDDGVIRIGWPSAGGDASPDARADRDGASSMLLQLALRGGWTMHGDARGIELRARESHAKPAAR